MAPPNPLFPFPDAAQTIWDLTLWLIHGPLDPAARSKIQQPFQLVNERYQEPENGILMPVAGGDWGHCPEIRGSATFRKD